MYSNELSVAFLSLTRRARVIKIGHAFAADGDRKLIESNPIVEYLDRRFPDGQQLLPSDPLKRYQARRSHRSLTELSSRCLASKSPLRQNSAADMYTACTQHVHMQWKQDQ